MSMTGRTHQQAAKITTSALVLLLLVAGLSLPFITVLGVFILFGEYFLSPDLDTRSRPYLRWGCLRWIWMPYQKLFRHRSIFTHTPLMGTTIRLLYLSPILMPLMWWTKDWNYFWVSVAGLESAALTHYFLDCFPIRQ